MNNLYKIAGLLDGDYDAEKMTLDYNNKRHYHNYFLQYCGFFFCLSHTLVFFLQNIKYDMVN